MFNKIKGVFSKLVYSAKAHGKQIITSAAAGLCGFVPMALEATPNDAVVSAFTDGMQTVQAQLTSMITGLIPSIIAILALTIGVYFGIRFIKKTVK